MVAGYCTTITGDHWMKHTPYWPKSVHNHHQIWHSRCDLKDNTWTCWNGHTCGIKISSAHSPVVTIASILTAQSSERSTHKLNQKWHLLTTTYIIKTTSGGVDPGDQPNSNMCKGIHSFNLNHVLKKVLWSQIHKQAKSNCKHVEAQNNANMTCCVSEGDATWQVEPRPSLTNRTLGHHGHWILCCSNSSVSRASDL